MLSEPSINRRILYAAVIVAIGSMLPKLALVGRDIEIAAHFGTTDQVDAYLIALLIPSMAVQVVAQSFTASLIPAFMRRREHAGAAGAAELAANATGFGLLASAALVVLLWLAGPSILSVVGVGFPHAKQALAGEYFMWFAPIALFQGAATIWGALLNAGGRFALVSMLPAVTPALCIAVLVSPLATHGMHAVVVATFLGALIEALLMAAMARRAGLPWPRFRRGPELGAVLRQSAPMVGGMALMNGGLLVDQLCATLAGSGGVAMLSYGNKVTSLLLAVAAMPLATAVLPYFSALAARRDVTAMRHSLRLWSAIIVVAAIPAALVVFALSEPIVRLLFERGHFSPTDSALVAVVQRLYVLQVPFYLLGTIGGRMLSALGLNRIVLGIASVNFVLNTVLDFALLRIIGLPGIALSTSLVYASSATLILLSLSRRLRMPKLAPEPQAASRP